MQLDSLLFCGRNVGVDCSRMQNLGVVLKNRFELRHAALYNNPGVEITSLENLASIYLGLNLNKVHRDEDFSEHPLPASLQKHAALDALVSWQIGEF